MALNNWHKIRPIDIIGSVAFLALAFCVFGWGLGYRLSLYNPPHTASHTETSVKLISGDEQPSTTKSQLTFETKIVAGAIHTTPASPSLILLLATNLSIPAFWGQRKQNEGRSWHLNCGILTTFFVRPPPILA